MKLKPLHDRLIVRAIDEEETTASGIVLATGVTAPKPVITTRRALMTRTPL